MASVLAFMGFYFALKYVESAIVSALEMGIGPLFVLLLAVFAKEYIPKVQWVIAIGTLFACIILIMAVLSGNSALQMDVTLPVINALVASVGCGIGAVLCTRYSKKLSEAGWTSSMILTHRYYGIILLSFMATYDVFFYYFSGNITVDNRSDGGGCHAPDVLIATRYSALHNFNGNDEFMLCASLYIFLSIIRSKAILVAHFVCRHPSIIYFGCLEFIS